MRLIFLFFTLELFFVQLTFAAPYSPETPGLSSQICIERLEGQGILNTRETRVIIDDKQAIMLVGGQAACVFLHPGNHYIYAESYDPYDPTSRDPKAWLSNKVQIQTQKGDMLEFLLEQAQPSNNTPWLIKGVERFPVEN